MCKKCYFLFSLFLLGTINLMLQAQSLTGKKASLNEDGSLSLEAIQIPNAASHSKTNFALLDGFPFGSPANPSFKNFRGGTLADLDGDGVQEFLFGANSKLFALKGDGSVLWT